jgi:hypothetical protein
MTIPFDAPSSANEGRRGRRENSVSHGRLCESKKHRRGLHRESRNRSRRPAQRAWPSFRECRKRHARWPVTPLRTVVLRPASRDPRWTPSYPPLADLLGFAVLALARFPARGRQGRPCDERNGSPEPRDFSRCEQGCVTPAIRSHRSRSAHRTRRATRPYLWIETRRNIILVWGESMAGEKNQPGR